MIFSEDGPQCAQAAMTIETPIGPLAATASERGILSLRPGMEHRAWASAAAAARHLDRLADAISRYFQTGRWEGEIPVDYGVIPQWRNRIYEALRRVPSGRLVSYGALAAAAGMPKAARAAAAAMRMNRLLIIVPCHRVVEASGRLGGFSAGLDLKIALLRREGIRLQPGRVPADSVAGIREMIAWAKDAQFTPEVSTL